MPRDFCGFSPQCLQTLYAGRTEQATYAEAGTGRTHPAYDEYVSLHQDRDRVVLVGSNGGMLMVSASGLLDTRSADLAQVYGAYTWAFLLLLAACVF